MNATASPFRLLATLSLSGFSLSGLSACSDGALTKLNPAPTATLSSHADGDTVREGYPEVLRGLVGDPNHAAVELSVSWLVAGASVCADSAPGPDGVVSCTHDFARGAGEVVLEVRDPEGGAGSARLGLAVQATDAPAAQISAPTSEGRYYSDQLVVFEGVVSDAEDAPEALTVAWASSLDGPLTGTLNAPSSEGALLGALGLSEGEHLITLSVTDATGKEGRDSATIRVGPANSAPSCAITAPETGAAGPAGELVVFSAEVGDVDMPADALAVTWASDKDGALGDSAPNSTGGVTFPFSGLSVNTHVVSMTVRDEVGATCTADVVYSVGTPPTLVLTAPASGDTVNEGASVHFVAVVADGEDLPTALSLSWSSDRDGVFSTVGADSSGAVAFSTSALSAGEHALTVRVTDTDGLYAQQTLDLRVNQPPTAPTVSLGPDPAFTASALTASAAGSTDPDGAGPVSYSYAWFEDGAPSAASTSATFPSASTVKHRRYRVVVTPSDAWGAGPSGAAELVVQNTAPVMAGPSLSASGPRVGDTLSCAASATDADVDPVAIRYTWSSGATGSSYTLTAADDPGDTLSCTATADDGDGGTASGTASTTVSNTSPTLSSVTVSPTAGRVGDTLTCAATAADADGGSPSLSYAWSTGATGSTTTLTASDDPGATVTCTATADDGDGGTATGSAGATVLNSAPVIGSVSIRPASATNDDTITCAAAATDADGGSLSLRYAWSNATTGLPLSTGATLDLSTVGVFSLDAVVCEATATDLDGGSATATASLTVSNRAPTVSVALSPSAGATRSAALVCAATPADADGDSLSTTFSWTVAGAPVAASATAGLSSTLMGAFAAGQTVVCAATSSDGKGGTASSSASTLILNSPPVLGAVSLSPSAPFTNDTLSALVMGSDPDGDSLSTTYAWFVEGALVASGPGASLSGAPHFDRDDAVYVVVTADDGTATSSATSAPVTVLNTPPTAPVVAITPADPIEGDELVCAIVTAATDADGDPLSYSFGWDVDGVAYTGAATTTLAGDTVAAGEAAAEELWTCAVTASDGVDAGAVAEDSVLVGEGDCGTGAVTHTASGIDFVTVCAGTFDMGCTPGQSSCGSDELPVRTTTLTRDYYISRTEVTQAQFSAVMGYNPSYFTGCGSSCPVERVSWHMAAAFANAVSALAGLPLCYTCTGSDTTVSCSSSSDPYSCGGYRLPTEAEWEGAARCGTDLMYSGSDAVDEVAWHWASPGAEPFRVGLLAPNSCGTVDMSGNLREWVHDWYLSSAYSDPRVVDPVGPATGVGRGERGGGYGGGFQYHRVANRGVLSPGMRGGDNGVRLVRIAP